MTWIEVNEAYALGAMPSEVRTAYDKWLVSYPGKAGRLSAVCGQVVADFRTGLGSNPNMVMEDGDAMVPSQCVPHATTIVFYHLMLEMGVAVNVSAQTAFINAEVYLRRLYLSDAQVEGAVVSRSPSYSTDWDERVCRRILGVR